MPEKSQAADPFDVPLKPQSVTIPTSQRRRWAVTWPVHDDVSDATESSGILKALAGYIGLPEGIASIVNHLVQFKEKHFFIRYVDRSITFLMIRL